MLNIESYKGLTHNIPYKQHTHVNMCIILLLHVLLILMYIYCQNMTFDTGHFLRLLSGTICAGDFTFNKLIFEHKIFSFTQV